MTPEGLEGLLSRVEGARGEDQQLERDILVALGVVFEDPARPSMDFPGRGALYYIAPDDGARVYGGLGDYTIIRPITASVDAALALIERAWTGAYWRVARLTPGAADAEGAPYWATVGPPSAQEAGVAATAPLALIAALLNARRRALLSQQSDTKGDAK
jgi:hypothetical protein